MSVFSVHTNTHKYGKMKQNHKMNNGRMFSIGPGLDKRERGPGLKPERERCPGIDQREREAPVLNQREREALVLTRERERPWS